ncbi:F-box/kelch-repeat protein At3g17530-like isoform X2 [Prosopis cineraria]|uniref:F-box/kelch-repeat protein At3g17530-like isoform X2 n=1 Tax=Prosopis cineraria TaxID=364024 RepID=UPI00240F025D|nr:F-box/kelch-repeat protein At3g17530-like isoform X2 [Prosopis cineraria]
MNRKKKRGASNLGSSSLKETAPVLLWTGQCKIQTLPPNIIIDILSRLPIKSILSCKRACKAWLRLISHPRFVELQLARSSTSILIKTIPSLSESRKIILTHVDQRGRDPYRFDKLMLTPKINLPCSKFGLLNSCNGLLCLSGVEKDDPIWVCNPILGEYVTIPPASEGRSMGSFIGLGFCAVTNRYKVLQTFHPKVKWSGNDYLDAEIYHMDTGTWKSIGYAPCALVAPSFNSFLRGSLHWVPSAGTKRLRRTRVTHTRHEFNSIALTPSLVSLYHVAKGELVQRVQGSKEYAKSLAEGTAEYAANFETSNYEVAGVNSTLDSVPKGLPVQREPGHKKYAKSAAAEGGNIECVSLGTLPNQPAGFNSTPFYGQRVVYQILNADQSREYNMEAANAESLGRISAQGFSAPPLDDVSSNLASKKSLPRWWQC